MREILNSRFIFCFFGIFVSYLIFGFLQEKINKTSYGIGEKFTYTYCLVLVQCIINLICSIWVKYLSKNLVIKNPVPIKSYIFCAITYTGAMICSNYALKWVNYPTQVIGKSIKPIPVMIFSVIFGKINYSYKKYVFVLLITTGVVIFMYNPNKSNHQKLEIGIGELLLILSLFFDGITAATQERMRKNYSMDSNSLMMQLNVWSSFILAIVVVLNSELFEFLSFCARNPIVMFDILLFSLTSALGQYFIFLTIASMGTLVCSIITTTRKFFTVLASVLFFGNPMSGFQWVGVVLVFSGLSLDSVFGKSNPKSRKEID